MISLQGAREQDWEVVRALRLAALQEAPEAFCSTHEQEAAASEDEWRSWTRAPACIVAFDEGAAVGMVAARSPGPPQPWSLVALWVAPTHRKQQVGRRLVEALVVNARASGVRRVVLGVVETNVKARRLYEECGFVTTGHARSIPGTSRRVELEMALELDSGRGVQGECTAPVDRGRP